MRDRALTAVTPILARHHADGLLVTSPAHIRWLTGFTGSNGLALATRSSVLLVTDGRYETQAPEEVDDVSVIIATGDLVDALIEQSSIAQLGRLVADGDRMSAKLFTRLSDVLRNVEVGLAENVLSEAVARKESWEVDRIRQAQAITDSVYFHLINWIKPGMSEQQIAAEVVHQHLLRGAERMAFDPIVASGPNSAKPHARPTARRLTPGDAVILDFGCFFEGYASDMTRTVSIGHSPKEFRKVYDAVLSAQEAALNSARPGMTSSEVDALGRKVISEAGYADFFVHSLGHGLGLEIHEWPRLSHRDEYPVPPNVTVTIEPGIYLPGRFGVRIEDIVFLGEHGSENLTSAPKQLVAI